MHLKVIAGIYAPIAGTRTVEGRVTAYDIANRYVKCWRDARTTAMVEAEKSRVAVPSANAAQQAIHWQQNSVCIGSNL
jgi:hypothetical protein